MTMTLPQESTREAARARARETAKHLVPQDNRIIVLRDEAPTTAGVGGKIHLPTDAQIKPHRGEVLAVGPGRLLESGKRDPITIPVGAMVLFSSYAGIEMEEIEPVPLTKKGEAFLVIMNVEEVLCLDCRGETQRTASSGT